MRTVQNIFFFIIFLIWPAVYIAIATGASIISSRPIQLGIYLLISACIFLAAFLFLSTSYLKKHSYSYFIIGMSRGVILATLLQSAIFIFELPICKAAELEGPGKVGMCGLISANSVLLSIIFIVLAALIGWVIGKVRTRTISLS